MAMLIRKNDQVKVISGKSAGKTGRVLRMLRGENRAVVEGVNVGKKHRRPTQKDQKGGIVDQELPVHVSNLMLLNKAGEPVRVVRREAEGKRVRVEKKTGKAVE